MKDNYTGDIRKIRNERLYSTDQEKAKLKDLKRAYITAKNRNLYRDGYSKGRSGASLESFTDLVENGDKMIERRNHPGFLAGYITGCEDAKKEKTR